MGFYAVLSAVFRHKCKILFVSHHYVFLKKESYASPWFDPRWLLVYSIYHNQDVFQLKQ